MRWVILSLLATGLAGCVQDGGYYDGPRSGYDGPRSGYDPPRSYPQSRWNDDQCAFRTRRGTIAGYKPEGKNRCCINTREGESCQRLD